LTKTDNKIRELIAQESAKVIIDEGINDYLTAKTKAADRLGFSGQKYLPKNKEIESAIEQHTQLFNKNTHQTQQQKLRFIALEVMEFLKDFKPYLTENILHGHVGQYNDIILYLPIKTPEEIMIKLYNSSIPFKEISHKLSNKEYPALQLVADETTIRLLCLPPQAFHQTFNNKSQLRVVSLNSVRNRMT